MEDPNNLDAIVQMAFLMPTMEMGVRLLEEGEAKGVCVPLPPRPSTRRLIDIQAVCSCAKFSGQLVSTMAMTALGGSGTS